MAAFAVGKVVRSERAGAVMTGGAASSVSRGKVHRGQRRRYLAAAGRAGLDRVAARAVHSRLSMSGMTEIDLKRACGFGCPNKTAKSVARTARRHLVRRGRGVTLETSIMRTSARRDRKRNTLPRRLMTRRAVRACVLRVIKPHRETLQMWKALHRAVFGVRMTDRADLAAASLCKLLLVTSDARSVTTLARETDPCGVVIAAVT
jgi:hypothetical protein